ncbi:MAG: hypothetical protein VW985_00660 [Gammaproteobacteria bacterium]
MSTHLPEAFSVLNPHAEKWALATEAARRETRMRSTQEELMAFYLAMKPLLDDAIQYLNDFDLDALPEPEQNLLNTALSLVEVSMATELFHNPWPLNAWPWESFSVAH